jgi:hypothetical protein
VGFKNKRGTHDSGQLLVRGGILSRLFLYVGDLGLFTLDLVLELGDLLLKLLGLFSRRRVLCGLQVDSGRGVRIAQTEIGVVRLTVFPSLFSSWCV